MTRRGSLAYYLAGWVCGCFFMSLGVWLPGQWEHTHWMPGLRGTSGFLASYFLSLVCGAFASLLFAFLLRRIARALGWMHLWQWTLLGAALGGLLVWGLSVAARALEPLAGRAVLLLILVIGVPRWFAPQALWTAVPAGAATAVVLGLIQRAFEPRR